jgi:uncharacterized protein
MRFWDTSALVPLLVHEGSSAAASDEYERDPDVVVWWLTGVECVSALARLERDGALSAGSMSAAIARLDDIAASWHEVLPVESVRRVATRLLRVHRLRAADALQLAAASLVAEERPETLPLLTLDARLADAAEREGFRVVAPGRPSLGPGG